MARSRGLGKGLGALIPDDTDVVDVARTAYRELPLDAITGNRYQPRTEFDEAALDELAASIRALGVLQPILVRPRGDGGFELVAGERRWRAAARAGLAVIPAIVRQVEDQSALAQAVVENVHRQDLHALEEAAAYQQLIEDFGLTQDDVARRVGRSRPAVANTLRLLQLPASLQTLVADGRLSAGHARALLGLDDLATQERLAAETASEGWSVRQLEQQVKLARGEAEPESDEPAPPPSSAAGIGATKAPALLELEGLLESHLDTRVKVTLHDKKGRVVVEFATIEDLERIYHAMTGAGRSGGAENPRS